MNSSVSLARVFESYKTTTVFLIVRAGGVRIVQGKHMAPAMGDRLRPSDHPNLVPTPVLPHTVS